MENRKGFTLIEILLVIVLMAVLVMIGVRAINPAKQLATTRNMVRIAHTDTIASAVIQYGFDHPGMVPPGISTTPQFLCRTDATDCNGLADVSDLTADKTYLPRLPIDPQCPVEEESTCYTIVKESNGRVVVRAPLAEQNAVIEAVK